MQPLFRLRGAAGGKRDAAEACRLKKGSPIHFNKMFLN
jgi:hypothetical protein